MTTPPDTDVRAARAAAAENAGRAGRWPLARLLLRIAVKLLLLSAVTSSMPACIIPVAPDFQDPEGIGNSPPEILNPTPSTDMMLSATPSTLPMFQVFVNDVNEMDHLFTEWLVDHHRAGDIQEVPNRRDNPVTRTLSCDNIRSPVSPHPVRFVVADRPIDPNAFPNLMDVQSPGKFVSVDWWLNVDCPNPTP